MRQVFGWLLPRHIQDEDNRVRGYTASLIAVGLMAAVVLLFPLGLLTTMTLAARLVLPLAFVGFLSAFLLARFGYVTASAALLIALVLLGVCSSIVVTKQLSFALFYLPLSILIASLTLRPWQIWIVLLANLGALALTVRGLPDAIWAAPENLQAVIGSVILLAVVSLISYLGASVLEGVMRRLRAANVQVEDTVAALARSNSELEGQVATRTADLQTALREAEARAEEQRLLLAENELQRTTIREMSVPVIPVSATTVVVPLVGALDSLRIAELQMQTLKAIEETRVRYLVLDITGVTIVDSHVAQGIVTVMQAARLLGAEVVLVGVRPEVAQSIVQLGLPLLETRAFSTLQTALSELR